MSDHRNTVTIVTTNGPLRIDASDYDPAKHKLASVQIDHVQVEVQPAPGDPIRALHGIRDTSRIVGVGWPSEQDASAPVLFLPPIGG
ncbi:hypothetical protein EJ070_31730 [Mesorhizobium sp. M1E.F.Ca.ET.045.02.1.1]|uniref:hypothetical protein n=1 Tax=Mesorhizobium sp. M1E.F.Ca.ET.045.02.1.1 TaxID=2493672 RepID=UPI000F760D65|nr:hypothetical protein [Mesorhizobium sp. M1E.F.Ca.ET.045.02.1.1]AZO24789.1 hypothetical protein EJ070_31730 [Mesorhizobium sp. M1E.F.Ca.ET.045.02.1.1]